MRLQGIKVGIALTGSHCTIPQMMDRIKELISEGAEVFPILSNSVQVTDSRFGNANDVVKDIIEITGHKPITTIVEAEPVAQRLFDIIVVAPCTGNTLAKMANAITDSPVLMAVKAHLRNLSPVVLAISTNDGLGANAKNIGLLLNMKNIFFVPFGQDNHIAKPNSLSAKLEFMVETIAEALQGKQFQPVIVGY